MSSTPTGTSVAGKPDSGLAGELGQVITLMVEDRSNDWSTEIATLTSAESALAELEQYRDRLGPISEIDTTSNYADLGEFVAATLGSNEDWSGAEILEAFAEHWKSLGVDMAISDQSDDELVHWRKIADRLGIEHDALEDDDDA